MRNRPNPHESCPYLGLRYDQATYSNFPSIHNVCYHAQPISTPAYSHQREFCLTKNFSKCPFYSAPEGSKFPQELQHVPDKNFKNRVFLILAICIALIFLILLGIYCKNKTTISSNISPTLTIENYVVTSTEKITKTSSSPLLASPTFTKPKVTPSPQLLTLTQSPSPSPTSTEILVFRLDNPIGINPQFIIHRAIDGESLELFANVYQTNVKAIRDVNHNLPRVLWIDQIVIIPLNQADVSGIPSFIAYEVKEESANFNQISEELSVSLEGLLRYNNAHKEYPLYRGDWILIPQISN